MPIQPHNREFLVSYIGIDTLPQSEQDIILSLLWNAIHNRIFDKLKMHIDEEVLEKFEMQFESDREAVLNEIRERVPEWDSIAAGAAKEVIAEFKHVRSTMKA